MHIRLASEKDMPHLIRLGKQLLTSHVSFDSSYYALEENFDSLFAVWVRQQLYSSSQFLFVAEYITPEGESARVVGFISGFVKALFPWFKTKSVGHISYLVVDTDYQKKGVGKLLEDAARNWFRAKNISYIELYVDEGNPVGQKAWSTYGFLPFKKFLRKKI